jgi:hypothetical protein
MGELREQMVIAFATVCHVCDYDRNVELYFEVSYLISFGRC